jgi:hypothetical protein
MSTYNQLRKHFAAAIGHSKLLDFHENKFISILEKEFNIDVEFTELEDFIVDSIHFEKDSKAFDKIMELLKKRV